VSASVRGWFGIAGLAWLAGCFDAAELTKGLACEKDSHCGGGLKCVVIPGNTPLASCQDLDEICDAIPGGCPDTSGTSPVTLDPSDSADPTATAESACVAEDTACGGPEQCCSGVCADTGAGFSVCAQSCDSGGECLSCCCLPTTDITVSACTQTPAQCGPDAVCPGGCGAAGSQCDQDYDCCGPGRCVFDDVDQRNECFTTCTVATDCPSGCCIDRIDLGTSLCGC